MKDNKDINNRNIYIIYSLVWSEKLHFVLPVAKFYNPTYLHRFWYIILGHPDKPGLHGKNAATQQLKPLEFAQCLLTGSLLQGNLLKDIGIFKVNLEMAILGFDLENETSVCVRNWELKLGSDFLQNPYFDNQQLLRNKSKLKLKYEVNPI